ncbi:hypothetical protein N2152v2_008254 [Parachlorella kessleri]
MVATRASRKREAGGSEGEMADKGHQGQQKQQKITEFVERVEGAEQEGGYDEESEEPAQPQQKVQKVTEEPPAGEGGGKEEGKEGLPPKTPSSKGRGKGKRQLGIKNLGGSPEEGAAAAGGNKEQPGEEVVAGQAEQQQQQGQGTEGEAGAKGAAAGKEGVAAGVEGEGEIERGRIYFLYRPKVGLEEAGSVDDVQRFFMILRPTRAEPVGGAVKARLAVIGKKRLPSVERKERFFGFIEASADTVEQLVEGLGERSYETKTRGTRTVGAARAAGEGTYAILTHGDHTHLAYKLEVPAEVGEVQQDLGIQHEGSYIISVKNPENRGGGANVGLEDKADYSAEKRREFRNYSWISVKDPQLLDYERCEFLLVGAADDLRAELGAGAQAAVEAPAEDEAPAGSGAEKQRQCPDSDEECLLEGLKEEIQAERVGIEVEPAATGEWKLERGDVAEGVLGSAGGGNQPALRAGSDSGVQTCCFVGKGGK